ncbi:uncharacterized protein LOC134771412 [Penaeus indicus]|uniref:uncharacterized protein LOC134771412 n=1 Tax=Penaeus indicus TaxID=29960 RepID=UPI00300CE516
MYQITPAEDFGGPLGDHVQSVHACTENIEITESFIYLGSAIHDSGLSKQEVLAPDHGAQLVGPVSNNGCIVRLRVALLVVVMLASMVAAHPDPGYGRGHGGYGYGGHGGGHGGYGHGGHGGGYGGYGGYGHGGGHGGHGYGGYGYVCVPECNTMVVLAVVPMVITPMYGGHGGRRSRYWYDGYKYGDSFGEHGGYGQNGYGGRYGGYVEYKPWKLAILNFSHGAATLNYTDPMRMTLLAMVAMAMVSVVMAHPNPGYGHGGYGYGGHGGGHGGYGYGGHGGGYGGYGGYGHGGGHGGHGYGGYGYGR